MMPAIRQMNIHNQVVGQGEKFIFYNENRQYSRCGFALLCNGAFSFSTWRKVHQSKAEYVFRQVDKKKHYIHWKWDDK